MALPSYIIQRNNKNRKIELTEFKNITNLNNIFNSNDFTAYLISRKYENPRKASEMGIYFLRRKYSCIIQKLSFA